MKHKRFWLIKPINILLMALSAILCGVLFFFDRILFYIFLPIVLLAIGWCGYRLWRIQRDLFNMITSMGRAMTDSHDGSLINFPLPCLIVSDTDEILWYNEMFRDSVLRDKRNLFGFDIKQFSQIEISEMLLNQGTLIEYNNRYYEAYALKNIIHDGALYLIYLVDVTTFQNIKLEAMRTRPVVMLLLIDNYEEAIGNEFETEKANLSAEVRNEIQSFVDQTTGFIRRLNNDRYLVVMEQQHLDEIVKKRFDLLDRVRNLTTESRISVTLSIGVAPVTDTLGKAEQEARRALDMALGRGGDQAVIKTETGYEFFGGYSKGVEKHTKVKTRIVASAMVELIKAADNVLIMGHRFADLDALGSAIGMAKACRCLGKQTHIILDVRRNLADVLVDRLIEQGDQSLLVQPENVTELLFPRTLLIIVDTHIPNLLESVTAYERCDQVVVIDHHRKMVNHISDAVIFYHEPYASSASEMVTELIQYFGDDVKLTRADADALFAGIMLDTKNFVMHTGVRTFEAAAYLRRLGADTIGVRQLFASTMDSYQRKTRIVSSAEIYKSCAIATCDFVADDIRVVAPQAADELLGISGVKASFVLYEQNDTVNISARSMGALNVQVIMERLGGGGHHTMAGAQLSNTVIDKVKQQLLEAIDKLQQEQKN